MLSTSSNALWGHILPLHPRRDTSTTPLPSSDASTARISMQPVQDRNATSLRVLLNSAEMSLQKFSSRVDELVLGVGEARTEVKHAGNLLDGVGDRVVGDVTGILNRMQGRFLETVREPAQQSTLQSLAAEHKAMSTKVDLMQLQLETFTTQQATLQASINALQPLVLVAERLSTRLESFESATANALAKLEGLVVEIASSLDNIKHPRDTPNKRYPSVSPPQSPEFPPFKRRKLDLTPSSPEIIPNSQPNSVGEDDSNDESNSSNMPTLRFSAALPLLHQTPPTLIKQAKYKLDNQLPIVPVSSPPETQNTNRSRSASSRSLENTNRIISPPLATNITEHSRASFPQSPQIGPGPQVEDFRKTPDQTIPQITNPTPLQPSLIAPIETSNTVQPLPAAAPLAFQLPAIPSYVQTNLKPKPARRTIKLDSDTEESQSGMVEQTCIDMLADL